VTSIVVASKSTSRHPQPERLRDAEAGVEAGDHDRAERLGELAEEPAELFDCDVARLREPGDARPVVAVGVAHDVALE
jgi:hypothetical protein